MNKSAMGSHQSARMESDTWLTPLEIINALGEFDLDPCTPEFMPWGTARSRFTKQQDGLIQPWYGRVFCNPPYGLQASKWLHKCAEYKNATALIFARTETRMFFDNVWNKADSLLFLEGRIFFHYNDGTRAAANSGAPSVLVAYDQFNSEALMSSKIKGKFIKLKQ